MKVFGVDPGSERTGYGCIETDGSRHRLVVCGAVTTSPRASFPEKLLAIHQALGRLLAEHRPDCVAVENVFYAKNVRSALKLGHARGRRAAGGGRGRLPAVRVHAGRDQAGGGRVRPRREGPGGRDGAAAAGARRGADAPRRGRRAGRGHLPRAQRASGAAREAAGGRRARRAPAAEELARVPTMIASLRGRLADKQPNRLVVDVDGVGYDVVVPLSTFYRLGDAGSDVVAAHPHARARGHARAVRVRHDVRAADVRAADQRQRHRAEAGAGGAVGHRAGRLRARRAARRRRAADGDSRRRQEDGRAHRPRAEGPAAAGGPAGAAIAARPRPRGATGCGATCSRRC